MGNRVIYKTGTGPSRRHPAKDLTPAAAMDEYIPLRGNGIGTQAEVDAALMRAVGKTPPASTRTSYTSTYTPSSASTSSVPTNKGINPAYVVGGIAAAGMGAAALEQYEDRRKHTPSMLETAATGTLGAMDSVVGTASTAMNIIETPLAPIAMGSMALGMLGMPIAGLISKTGFTAPLRGAEWAANKLQNIQEATFSEVGRKISPKLGQTVENVTQKAIKTAAPVLDKISYAPGLGGLHSSHLKNAPKEIAKTSAFHGVWQATWVGGAAIQNYMVAREFGAQVYALRRLQAKLTNKDVSEISTFSVLTGSVEKPVAIARSQLLKISGAHAFASIAGLGMALKSHKVNEVLGGVMGKFGLGGGGHLGMMGSGLLMMGAFSAPVKISEFVESVVGEPILAAYSAMQDAEDVGHKFSAEELAGFLYAASEQLRNRGRAGQEMAMQLGAQYATEGMTLAGILKEVHGTEMKQRIDAINAAKDAAKAAAPAGGKKWVNAVTQPAASSSVVNRIIEKQPVLGKHTAAHVAQQQAGVTPAQLGA